MICSDNHMAILDSIYIKVIDLQNGPFPVHFSFGYFPEDFFHLVIFQSIFSFGYFPKYFFFWLSSKGRCSVRHPHQQMSPIIGQLGGKEPSSNTGAKPEQG
eukprot:TRINITY_DN2667_c0_g1_i1.p1 TRINITY_DN2667_c0_g1~~TRINITY_DN2667_c0_g1_i1.p1  ORF type:complete len:101 (+),score=8.26 TRINITY_DN2667_c0_g1_i1:271-573(+)